MAQLRACPVCHQHNASLLAQPAQSPGPVSRCRNCGMVYVETIQNARALIQYGPVLQPGADPKILTSADLEDVRGSWEFGSFPDPASEWPALRRNAAEYLDQIERYTGLSEGHSRLFDFGSGWGIFLAAAQQRGWLTRGLEPLPAASIFARAAFGLDITTDTLREQTFPVDYFDAVTAFQVFEHLPDPQADLLILHKILRRGGVLVIEVPCFKAWHLRLTGSRYRHFAPDHLNFFCCKTLNRLLADAGFELLQHCHPCRRMSLSHLSRCWLRRYLPARLSNTLDALLKRLNWWNRTVGLNFGDIITVIGRKPSPA